MRVLLLLSARTALAAPVVTIAAPVANWANLPLSFEPGLELASGKVGYLSRGNGYTLYLGDGEMRLADTTALPCELHFPE